MSPRGDAKQVSAGTVLSLFTGAGGLDFGLQTAGFEIVLCVEKDQSARETLLRQPDPWRLAQRADIHDYGPRALLEEAGIEPRELTVLSAGPPCQPFSKAAYWRRGGPTGLADPRASTILEFLRLVDAAQPNVVLMENVGGTAFREGGEGWQLVRSSLREVNHRHGVHYRPHLLRLNSAHYGVPQARERAFIVAHRGGRTFTPPPRTHFPASEPGASEDGVVSHRTAWDAIGDLDRGDWSDDLVPRGKWAALLPSVPEGKNYLWHTPRAEGEPLFGWRTRYWSFLLKLAKDRPSWTIPANPGPATGPFHWRNRFLSVRELCRLQTFPDSYRVSGSRKVAQRQVGNAVPPAMGELLGLEIRRQLLLDTATSRKLTLIPDPRNDCPGPGPVAEVPQRYLSLRGDHAEHPGIGLGPGGRAGGV